MPAVPEYFRRIGRRPRYPQFWAGCIGAWAPCLGPTGAHLFDLTGNGSRGVLTNTTLASAWALTNGRYGVLLDGSNDQIIMGDLPILEPEKHVSICAWITPSVTTQATDASIAVKEYSNPRGSPFCSYKLGVSGSQKYKFEFAAGSAPIKQVLGTTSPAAGVTVFLAGTYDGATARTYVNGIQEASGSFSGAMLYSNGRMMCGTDETGGSAYAGSIHELRVYNRALTPGEIFQLYAGGRGWLLPYATATRGWYPNPATFNPAWAANSRIIQPGVF